MIISTQNVDCMQINVIVGFVSDAHQLKEL